MPHAASHRLPRSASPTHYDIEIVPDLDAATFTGHVGIDVRVEEDLDRLVLNATDLRIGDATVAPDGGEPMAATAEVVADEQQLVLDVGQTLAAGTTARVEIAFEGELAAGLRGFYRSTVVDNAGATHAIGSTQFEATDARRAFPCWDEPDRKATFSVSLVVPDHLTGLSSGRLESREELGDDRVRLRFAPTIPMSTYVLAWVVGPFELTEPVDVRGVPLRLAVPEGRLGLTDFGLEAATHALTYLAGYFGVPYPGDKLDHVAVPDFAFGAMENMGCVLYRDTALLADPDAASQLELSRVAAVVAHETAHMWFGNLVTMRWWNGIWLNEAFATFMELKALDAYRPVWDSWTTQTAGKAEAQAIDGLSTTRPVEYAVGRPEEADAMFDSLTYDKGASVLRMLEHFLGEETFRRGIAAYLTKHRYDNTETTDLWDALEAESGQPVRAVMDSWIFQAGYPVVRVAPDPSGTGIRLTQRPFRYLGEGSGHWVVPVSLRASVGGQIVHRRVLLDEGEATVELGGPVDWVIANEEGTGFYRTASDPSLRPPLADLGAVATPIERVHLLGDAWAEVAAGMAEPGPFLELVTSLGRERDPDVWRSVAAPMATLEHIAGDEHRSAVAALVRRAAGPAFAALGWEPGPDESARTGMARGRLVALLGTIGADPEVRAEAAERHSRFLADGTGLAPDVLTGAVATVAAAGGEEAYELILRCYRSAATPQDRMRYLLALAGFSDPTLVRRTLDLALGDEVRTQDGPLLIGRALAGQQGAEVVWPWIEGAIDGILERHPRNLLMRIFESLEAIADPATADRVHRFLAAHPMPIGGPRMAQVQELMDVTVALAARLRPTLAATLAAG